LNATSQAVFVSYASQDAEAAGRICEALRAAGIEVWFDQSELRGGDAWDQSIRKQIKTCALFVPIISKHTHERAEGYFRLEWKLAVDRSHLITSHKAFLLPVVIDETSEEEEHVPDKFRDVQWTRLPGGVTPVAFVERVRRLLAGALSQEPTATASAAARAPAAPTSRKPVLGSWRSKAALLATIAVVVVALGYLVANRLVVSKRGAEVGAVPGSAAQSAPATAFNPPAHSIAVLPFVNLSGDKEQEYFSDGLTEELLNSLAAVQGLKVAARTSSFLFKGKAEAVGDIARKLNVAAVLEGSVRRDKSQVRISAELIDAASGFQVWSQKYDRNLRDVLALQSEIASSVGAALKITLLQADARANELGGTDNPKAFDAYLRGEGLIRQPWSTTTNAAATAAYDEAIALDPHYAIAYVGRSRARALYAGTVYDSPADVRKATAEALSAARTAIELAPALGIAHASIAEVLQFQLDYVGANTEYVRALELAPGDARVTGSAALFLANRGRFDEAIAHARHAAELDPLNATSYIGLGDVYFAARRFSETLEAYSRALELDSSRQHAAFMRGYAYYALGDYELARRSCETSERDFMGDTCLAMVYFKLGRRIDAQAALDQLFRNYPLAGASYQAT
jgi:TolB-like protein/tetratricopeptide (TPR) repeat protein